MKYYASTDSSHPENLECYSFALRLPVRPGLVEACYDLRRRGDRAGFGRIPVSALNRIGSEQGPGKIDMVVTNEMPAVFAKFQNDEMLAEMGRLVFSLLNAFVVSGYRVTLADNLPPAKLGKYGRMACSLPNVSLSDAVPADTSGMIYLFDREDRALAASP